jgi:tetratricopeptide (TPR) repeat protein
MSEPKSMAGRLGHLAGLSLALLLGFTLGLSAQDLPVKRVVPGVASFTCPTFDATVRPTAEEAAQAVRLGSDADQALILGNQERARDLLARAAELDPTSVELAYRYGRVLESLGESDPAIRQFCRVLALGWNPESLGDVRYRLEVLVRAREPEVPQQARDAFLDGLLHLDLGNLGRAVEAFGLAMRSAPGWADAAYNRGVVLIRMGSPENALGDLQRYLELAPEAADALAVSRMIGQLQIRPASSVSPGTALALGLILPGMGQFYSGRALGGLSVLTLAGGAAAAGFVIEREEVRCVGSLPAGGQCPPERIISRETTNPYLLLGLASAGVIAVVGAVEAFLKAKGDGSATPTEPTGLELGGMRAYGPSLSAHGLRVDLNLVRVTF